MKKIAILFLGFVLCQVSLYGQAPHEILLQNKEITLVNNQQITHEFNFSDLSANHYRINGGFLALNFLVAAQYTLESEFNSTLDVSIKAYLNGTEVDVFDQNSFSFSVNQNKQKSGIILKFNDYLDENEHLQFDQIQIEVTSLNSNNLDQDGQLHLKLASQAKLEYDVDVRSLNSPYGISLINDEMNRTLTVQWSDAYYVSHYQVEVLRLFNTSPIHEDDTEIIANVDWENAIRYRVDLVNPTEKKYTFEVPGSSGYYAIRIRSIGAFYNGGEANFANWGLWSNHIDDTNGKPYLKSSDVDNRYIYISDSDVGKNWSMERVYMENSKSKTTMTYADDLLRVRQQQTYLPSKEITLVQQTVYDYAGRSSLVSVPVPIDQKLDSYRSSFMKAAGSDGEVYQAKHFDTDANQNSPAQVATETGDFSYYHDNSNASIANLEGYPYTRTLFYNDGLNRVREQSGVGLKHSLNSTNGGKTTRYFYTSPAEEELIAIFGNEAPLSSNVSKVITIDPNGTTSVSYITKEGYTIATCLSFSEADGNLVDIDDTKSFNSTFKETVTRSVKTKNSFFSSKNVFSPTEQVIQLGYSVKANTLSEMCVEIEANCDYRLTVIQKRLNKNGQVDEEIIIYDNVPLSNAEEVEIEGEGYKILSTKNATLLAGQNYVFEKYLTAGDLSSSIKQNEETIKMGINPFIDLVAGWLKQIESVEDIDGFNRSIVALSTATNNGSLGTFTNEPYNDKFPVDLPSDFIAIYNSSSDYSSRVIPDGYDPNSGSNPTYLILGTPCCGDISISIDWIPEFDYDTIQAPIDANNNNRLDIVNFKDLFDPSKSVEQEFFPDFEGYMLTYLESCVDADGAYPTLEAIRNAIYRENNYMKGWEREGTLNLMIYHMLTDVYNQGTATEPDERVAYEAKQLFDCWESVLSRVKNQICDQNIDLSEGVNGDVNASERMDDETGDESVHDNHFDRIFRGKSIKKWFLRAFFKKKLSRRIRNAQNADYVGNPSEKVSQEITEFNLVNEFLNCTGYQYAKIITSFDATPINSDRDNNFVYRVNNTTPPTPYSVNKMNSSSYFSNTEYITPLDAVNKYIPLSGWGPGEELLPRIYNPIYAFKYFEYEGEGLDDYFSIEAETCYSDPNKCYQLNDDGFVIAKGSGPSFVDCCDASIANDAGCYRDYDYPGTERTEYQDIIEFCEWGRVRCAQTKWDWSPDQRVTFYNLLENFKFTDYEEEPSLFDDEYNCNLLEEKGEWYVYTCVDCPETYAENANLVSILSSSMLTTLLSESDYSHLHKDESGYVLDNEGYIIYEPLFAENEEVFNGSYIEYQIVQRLEGCADRCEERAQEFKHMLITELEDKCYEIGGCRTNDESTFNIIPEEDIDLIVDALVNSCQSQCVLTTYACTENSCRAMTKSRSETGFDNDFSLNVDYGVGGTNGSFTTSYKSGVKTYSYADADNCVELTDTEGIYKCKMIDNNGNFIDLSWFQYTLLDQVDGWLIELDLKSYCEDETDDENLPFDESTTTNSTKGNTYLPKDEYIKPVGSPIEPVYSGVKSINITVNE